MVKTVFIAPAREFNWCFTVSVGFANLQINGIAAAAFCSMHTAVQKQNVVSAYFTSKQILHFAFAEQHRSKEKT